MLCHSLQCYNCLFLLFVYLYQFHFPLLAFVLFCLFVCMSNLNSFFFGFILPTQFACKKNGHPLYQKINLQIKRERSVLCWTGFKWSSFEFFKIQNLSLVLVHFLFKPKFCFFKIWFKMLYNVSLPSWYSRSLQFNYSYLC